MWPGRKHSDWILFRFLELLSSCMCDGFQNSFLTERSLSPPDTLWCPGDRPSTLGMFIPKSGTIIVESKGTKSRGTFTTHVYNSVWHYNRSIHKTLSWKGRHGSFKRDPRNELFCPVHLIPSSFYWLLDSLLDKNSDSLRFSFDVFSKNCHTIELNKYLMLKKRIFLGF
jgi:hypothetical protein